MLCHNEDCKIFVTLFVAVHDEYSCKTDLCGFRMKHTDMQPFNGKMIVVVSLKYLLLHLTSNFYKAELLRASFFGRLLRSFIADVTLRLASSDIHRGYEGVLCFLLFACFEVPPIFEPNDKTKGLF